MPPESAEEVMLTVVAYHDPIDYRSLRSIVGERLGGEYDSNRHRKALDNLLELGLIQNPGKVHVQYHISEKGWRHLGGETSRYGEEIDPGQANVCLICVADEIANESWSSALY